MLLRRVVLPCLASLLLYATLFGAVLDRPLSLGMFRQLIDAKLARGAAIEGPKLVILAGSNGPYSHRCETIEPLLGMPCVNAGIAVGIGLDYLFARWRPLLHPGDVVYMPLEEAQYVRTYAATALGPDAEIMFRHDWPTLAHLGSDRILSAMFSFSPRAGLMSAIETVLVLSGFVDPREAAQGSTNAWGDHVGHTQAQGEVNAARLAIAEPYHESVEDIASGDGTAMVHDFLTWATGHGVRVIGGLPAGFAESPIPEATRNTIRAIFIAGGAGFIDLGDRGRYPRSAFFDTPDHLNEAGQIAHSRAVAAALAGVLAAARLAPVSVPHDPVAPVPAVPAPDGTAPAAPAVMTPSGGAPAVVVPAVMHQPATWPPPRWFPPVWQCGIFLQKIRQVYRPLTKLMVAIT
jgi:hypothetical protein